MSSTIAVAQQSVYFPTIIADSVVTEALRSMTDSVILYGNLWVTDTTKTKQLQLTGSGFTEGHYLKIAANGAIVGNPITGALVYKGVWIPETNTPTLVDGTGTNGDFYRVFTDGDTITIDLGSGDIDFENGSDVIYNGSTWQKIPNYGFVLQIASSSVLGGVKIGDNILIDEDGTISIEKQTLTAGSNAGEISISEGNTVTLNVNDADHDPENEIQAISILNDVISITKDASTVDLVYLQDSISSVRGYVNIVKGVILNEFNLGKDSIRFEVDTLKASLYDSIYSHSVKIEDIKANYQSKSDTLTWDATKYDLRKMVGDSTVLVLDSISAHNIRLITLEGRDDFTWGMVEDTLDFYLLKDSVFWVKDTNGINYQAGNIGVGTVSNANAKIATDGAVVFGGTFGSDSIPVEGAGTRMIWYPAKAAFRAGYVSGTQWDKANIGDYSVAMGYSTTASDMYSTAMGYGTRASGAYSTAMGSGATASGNYSTAMGVLTTASDIYSTAMGYNTRASGSYSTAMGYSTTASGTYSTAMGANTTAPSGYETVTGRYNTTYTPYNATGWNDSDRLFVIGNGTGTSTRSNAMTMLKSGYTGFGTDEPSEVVDIDGNVKADTGKFDEVYLGTDNVRDLFLNPDSLPNYSLAIFDTTGFNVDTTQVSDLLEFVQNNSTGGGGSSQWTTDDNGITYTAGNVGIGVASSSLAKIATNGSVLFSGTYSSTPGNPPASGAGARMMWYPAKAAFRAGYVNGTQWNKVNVGAYSTAMGGYTTASGDYSTAMGYGSVASGLYSTAMGAGTTANGTNSTAMGYNTTAIGSYSTAMGGYTTASGDYSSTMGYNTTAPSYVETVFGRYNKTYTGFNATSWKETDRLFVIGNGTGTSTRSNALTMLKSGYTGFGTDEPSEVVDIDGNVKADTGKFDEVYLGTDNVRDLFLNPDSLPNYSLALFDTTGFKVDTTQVTDLLEFVQNNSTGGGGSSQWGDDAYGITYTAGNVGVGVASNANHRLDVSGNININTNGTSALISTYEGENSDGNNIFIGGGGQSSIGAVGATTSGSYNTFNGYLSGYSNTTGSNNTFNGYLSGYFNTTGAGNVFNGSQSGYSNTTGSNNVFNGYLSGYFNTIGAGNVFNGSQSGYSNTSGSSNVFNGYQSGRYLANGTTGRTTGNYGLYLGAGTRASANGTTNEIVIGYNAIGNGSNTATYGNTSMVKHIFSDGKVGIGTTSPSQTLTVNGDMSATIGNFTGGLYINNTSIGDTAHLTPASWEKYIADHLPTMSKTVKGAAKIASNGGFIIANSALVQYDSTLTTGTPKLTDVIGFGDVFSGFNKKTTIADLLSLAPTGTSQWTTDDNGINYQAGNVGIGTSSVPFFSLKLKDGILVEGNSVFDYTDFITTQNTNTVQITKAGGHGIALKVENTAATGGTRVDIGTYTAAITATGGIVNSDEGYYVDSNPAIDGNGVFIPAKKASAPTTPITGMIYFNTNDNHFYGYNGTTWKQLDN